MRAIMAGRGPSPAELLQRLHEKAVHSVYMQARGDAARAVNTTILVPDFANLNRLHERINSDDRRRATLDRAARAGLFLGVIGLAEGEVRGGQRQRLRQTFGLPTRQEGEFSNGARTFANNGSPVLLWPQRTLRYSGVLVVPTSPATWRAYVRPAAQANTRVTQPINLSDQPILFGRRAQNQPPTYAFGLDYDGREDVRVSRQHLSLHVDTNGALVATDHRTPNRTGFLYIPS